MRCGPAIEAVMKHATLPATIALSAKQAKSDRRDGARALSAPSWIATEQKLLKPQSAYVAINCERSCNMAHNGTMIQRQYAYYTVAVLTLVCWGQWGGHTY